MSENIFQIWDRIGRKIPFAVRRDNWPNRHYTVVEQIECENLPYGKAKGYPTDNGSYSNHYEYDKRWREEKRIPCDGCYQWTLVENADQVKYTDGVKAAIKVKGTSAISSPLFFGKYKGTELLDAFKLDPSYIDWAIINIDGFILTSEAFDYLNQLQTGFSFSNKAKEAQQNKLQRIK